MNPITLDTEYFGTLIWHLLNHCDGATKELTTKITDSHWQRTRDCNNNGLPTVTMETAARTGCSVHLFVRHFAQPLNADNES